MLSEGKKAPTFQLHGSDGAKHALSDYAGRYVVLYFYPKDDTPGCTKEACGFRDMTPELEALDAVVLGVSPDSEDSHNAFIEKFNLPFLLLSDPDKKVMAAYGAWGEKVLYGKKSIGVIRSTTIIDPKGQVAKHWKKVPNAEKHPAKVYEELQKLINNDT